MTYETVITQNRFFTMACLFHRNRGMARIIEKRGGIYQFSARDGWFIFQAIA